MEESKFSVEGMSMNEKAISGIVHDINGERVIHIRGKVVQAIRLDLGNILGPNVVREIFYRIGLNAASVAHEQSKQMLTSEKDLWSMADHLTQIQGWGRIRHYEKAGRTEVEDQGDLGRFTFCRRRHLT